MDKIRVLVANRPRLMRELVLATISDQPDIEVTGEIKNDSDIARVVEESSPDFVIVALDRSDRHSALCEDLLTRFPKVKILALAPERNSSMFFWAVVNIRSKGIESSEEGILSVLRGKVELVGQ